MSPSPQNATERGSALDVVGRLGHSENLPVHGRRDARVRYRYEEDVPFVPQPGPGIVEGRCIQWAGTTGTTAKPPSEVALPCRPGCDCHPCMVRAFGQDPAENDPRA